MATSRLSRDSFPSPSQEVAAAFSSSASGAGGGDAELAGASGCCTGRAGGESRGGAGASCPRRGDAPPHGLGGTGGLRCVPGGAEAAPAPARRCSCVRFAAGDGDLRPGRSPASRRRGGGGGEGDARPPPPPTRPAPGTGEEPPLSRLARRAASPGTAAARLLADAFAGDRSGPAAVVAAEDSDATSDFSSPEGPERVGPTARRALAPPPSFTLAPPTFALATASTASCPAALATRLGLGLGLAFGVSESTSLTVSSSGGGGGGSRASDRRRAASPTDLGDSLHFLLTQQPIASLVLLRASCRV